MVERPFLLCGWTTVLPFQLLSLEHKALIHFFSESLYVQKLRHLAVLTQYTCLHCACIILVLVTWPRAVLAFCLGLFRKRQEGRGGKERGEGKRQKEQDVSPLLTCACHRGPSGRVCALPQVAGSHLSSLLLFFFIF